MEVELFGNELHDMLDKLSDSDKLSNLHDMKIRVLSGFGLSGLRGFARHTLEGIVEFLLCSERLRREYRYDNHEFTIKSITFDKDVIVKIDIFRIRYF